jgi:hypothetical protein
MEQRVDPRWRKSSYSGNGGEACLEVGSADTCVLVRDTTNRTGTVLTIAATAWRTLLTQIRA